MNGWKRQAIFRFVVGAWAIVSVSVASGQEFKSAPPEQSVRGLTVAEHFAQQQQLHAWLTRDMPDGTLATRIGIGLTRDELLDLERRAPAAGEPLRIGIVKSLSPALDVSGLDPKAQSNRISQVAGGSFQTTDDGGYVWAISIGSEGADGIRVHFRNFSLPPNAEMYFFNLEGEAHGPYQAQGRNGSGDFWTDTVFSDSGVILLRHFGPASGQDQRDVSFVIDKVGHIGRGFPAPGPQGHNWSHDRCGNASCVLDANCNTTDSSAVPALSAVAKMEWIRGAFIFTCSGGLIADTDNTEQRNLFLTANHCLSKKRNARNLETFFFYKTTSCNEVCPGSPAAHTIGSTILRSSLDGDFTLLELSQDPPALTTFLGWNNSAVAHTGGVDLYRISNPNFGPQVFSHHRVNTGGGTCRTLPRGEFIYSADHHGATDRGSSGSPVVNSAGEVVGQLFGCCGFDCGDVCAEVGVNFTVDGALAFYFDQVADFLDPQGGGGCTSDPECDDGEFCNGAEICVGGSCQGGSDPCPGQDCNEGADQCVDVTCGRNKAPCDDSADCCSGKCTSAGICRGN